MSRINSLVKGDGRGLLFTLLMSNFHHAIALFVASGLVMFQFDYRSLMDQQKYVRERRFAKRVSLTYIFVGIFAAATLRVLTWVV